LRDARTAPDCAEVSAIRRQHSVDVPSLGYSGNCPIDQSEVELLEPRVQFEGSNDIRGEWLLIFIAGSGIKDLGYELTHGCPVLAKEVAHFGENEAGGDDDARGGWNLLVLRKARSIGLKGGASTIKRAIIAVRRRSR